MKEYECKDIIKTINSQRTNLRKVALLKTISNLDLYLEKVPDKRAKEQAGILINEIKTNSKHWIENEFLEITYNPKGEPASSTTTPDRKSTILSNPNPEYADGHVVEYGTMYGEQKAIGPAKPVPVLMPHQHKVLSEKDKKILKDCLYEARESAGLCYDNFVKIAKDYSDYKITIINKLEKALKNNLNGEESRIAQYKIDNAKNHIKIISSMLTKMTVNLPPNSVNSRTITSKLIELSNDPETKDTGARLHSKFEEFKFYTILRNVLVVSDKPDNILQELINNKVQLTNCVKFFDNNTSTNRANGLLNIIINILKRTE
jgi:hypothetical protein